ncbi:MAG TPA: flagellar basal-body MS-ring/collar protein FliF [Terracidiphilus sp.]|jgi:flagellar M-ring protein FliF|nr:flagellar basal-body MS-ring/collar protein FliF [Terracidiphilus sp.]
MASLATQLERSATTSPATISPGPGPMTSLMRGKALWVSMSSKQRIWTLTLIALIFGLSGYVAWYGSRTDWRTLYAGLDPDDARQIGLLLTQAQIPYDVAANGTEVRVAAPQLDKARLIAAAKGGVKSGRMGFELFDKPNWVGSEFDEQVNFQRALEGELEHTIGTLADIDSARVHLVVPHESLFREEERPAKASVVLKLRHGTMADGEADSVRNLVSSAVDGLSPDRVVLVDAAGRLPLGPKTEEALHFNAERLLEEKLISTLESVAGIGNVHASVTLDYDQAATDETEETYNPDRTVTLSMQRTEQTSGGQPVAAGIPGTASNAPNSQSLPVYPKLTSPLESSKSESGTYGVSKSVRHTVLGPGRVHRLTAAVVVNDRLVHAASKSSSAQWQPWTPEQLRGLTALAQAAVGFDANRGDVLSVEDLAFDANRPSPSPSAAERMVNTVESFPALTKALSFLLALTAVVFLVVRPALGLAARSIKEDGLSTGKLGGSRSNALAALPSAEAPAVDPERVKAHEVFEQVTDRLKHQPAQSSRLIQSWIHSE